MIIIEYDQNPKVPLVRKIQSLAESVQMAMSGVDNELAQLKTRHTKDSADISRKVDQLASAVDALSSQISALQTSISTMQGQISTMQGQISAMQGSITTINGNISTINGKITALEAVADDAITVDRSVTT